MLKRIYDLNEKVISYLQSEKAFNTYIISDLEILGLESGVIELYNGVKGDRIDYILMRYGQSFVLYSENAKNVNIKEVATFLKSFEFDFRITGKREIIEILAKHIPKAELDHNYFATVTEKSLQLYTQEDGNTNLIRNCSVMQVIDGYTSIEEYREKYKNTEKTIERINTNNLNGRYYGLENEGKLVAMVCSAAESCELAMISEVGTVAEYRNRGFSKILVSNLCKDLFGQGKKELSIFYSNPIAKSVYEAIGFKEIGEYSMLIYKM